jgi:hypothetical protein
VSDDLLPPLSQAQRELLALMYRGDRVLRRWKVWTHVYHADGRMNLEAGEPKTTTIAGLNLRNLIALRRPTDVEFRRGAYTEAYEITPEGRAAHEALARRA